MKISELARKSIRNMVPYKPGKPMSELERELGISDIAKLASNENMEGPPVKALEAMYEAIKGLNYYPDGNAYYARKAIGRKHGFDISNIVVGNGSDEILVMLGQAFLETGDEAISGHPSFLRYRQITTIAGAKFVGIPLVNFEYDLDSILEAITDKTKLIFIANPNNPTGTIVRKKAADRFISKIPGHVIVVFDEAYYDYIEDPEYPDSLEYLRLYPEKHIIVLRSLSKSYSLAGLRFGYAIASPELIRYLEIVRGPFNVNTISQAAAVACLEDRAHAERARKLNSMERDFLYEGYKRLGVRYVETHANFILIDLGVPADGVYEYMLRKGVITRPMEAWGLGETFLRVTIGTRSQNERLLRVLEEALEEARGLNKHRTGKMSGNEQG